MSEHWLEMEKMVAVIGKLSKNFTVERNINMI